MTRRRDLKPRRIVAPLVVAAAALAGAGLFSLPAVAGKAHAPLGYQLMCLRTPAECQGGGASQVAMTSAVMATIKQVNKAVNNAIVPHNDGSVDVWNANAVSGDCEDYVMAKRRALIKAGLPPSALRIAFVRIRSGEGHAILVVKTDKGDIVLDNLNRSIRPLSQSGYRIVSISGANPETWS